MSDDHIHIGDVRGSGGPLGSVTLLRKGIVEVRFNSSLNNPSAGEIVLLLNQAQAARLSELLASAVKAHKAATP